MAAKKRDLRAIRHQTPNKNISSKDESPMSNQQFPHWRHRKIAVAAPALILCVLLLVSISSRDWRPKFGILCLSPATVYSIEVVNESPHDPWTFTQELKGRVPGIEVNAVDTTGAGDSFVGGLLYALAANHHLYEDEVRLTKALRFAIAYAIACGVATVTKRGAIPALPTKEAALEKQRGATD